jgi:asparagine synthase (glutamine-hydrolysing)
VGEAFAATSQRDLFARMNARYPPERELVLGAQPAPTLLGDPEGWPRLDEPLRWMTWVDLAGHLSEGILTKVDRASMAVSLEVRCPLLDHRVVEFALRLPSALKVRGHERKWLLRQVLDRYVPRALSERPKMGFGVPIGEWLRGPLLDWAEDLLDETRLRREGFLDARGVREIWRQHRIGWRDRRYLLWNLLCFQAWREEYGEGADRGTFR